MQPRRVVIDGNMYDIAVINNERMVSPGQIATLLGINKKTVGNAYLNRKKEIRENIDTFLIVGDDIAKNGIIVSHKHPRIRMFNKKAYMVIAAYAGVATAASILAEQLFDDSDIPTKMEVIRDADDEILDVAMRIIDDRKKMRTLEEENSYLKKKNDSMHELIQGIHSLIERWSNGE